MGSPMLDTLLADIKTAMKAQAPETLTALRMLNAQIKDATVNAGKDPTDEAVATIVAKAIKQRQDSVEQFKAAGRNDLADKEQREIELFRAYQPQQLGAAEIEALVRKVIAETGAVGKKDLGKVMQALMPQVKGKSDGKLVNQIVMAQLGG
ncbi:MAG: GatB/YqeY domain-containing protein [bacterium]